MRLIKRLVQAHRFFVHKSQWYVLGGWYEYVADKAKRRKYCREFPRAYCRFMWYTLGDAVRE